MKLLRITVTYHPLGSTVIETFDNITQVSLNNKIHKVSCITTSGAHYAIPFQDLTHMELYDTKP